MGREHSAGPAHRAIVDAAAIRDNVRRCVQWADGAAVMGVVKAGGYGHGALAAARATLAGGATLVGVAQPTEAVALRRGGIEAEILAWLLTPRADLDDAVAHDITLGVAAPWALEAVRAAGRRAGRPVRVHVELDTGMSRGGIAPRDWQDLFTLARAAEREGSLVVEGVFSHLACADDPTHPATDHQRDAFEQGLATAVRAGLDPRWRHLSNSAATVTRPDLAYDLVRPGLVSYGLSPIPELRTSQELGVRPAMTLVAPVSAVRWVPPGTGVSYSHTHVTRTERWLGVVPLGYGDGVPRGLSDRGRVRVAGREGPVDAPFVGRVCMDQFVVDLGPATGETPPVTAGDEVVLFGDGADGGPTAQDWAAAMDTISYEIVTRVGPRVPREVVGQN
ncbi:alanine racemase [Kytococcus sedentarius]|uniref:alanine racemase n=1 Tax=Kytococcus sedentarius TaxID=1276 RepID=UPI0035BC82E1